jgi:tetratricopeptide (TPR) repeat protein
MNSKSLMCVVMCIICALSTFARQHDPLTVREIDNDELVRRHELSLTAQNAYRHGRDAFFERRHEDAASAFITAQHKLIRASRTVFAAEIEKLEKVLSVVYIDWADQLVKEAEKLASLSKYEDALQRYDKAQALNPKLETEVTRKRKHIMKLFEKTKIQERVYGPMYCF